jgi:hypothetical protein
VVDDGSLFLVPFGAGMVSLAGDGLVKETESGLKFLS